MTEFQFFNKKIDVFSSTDVGETITNIEWVNQRTSKKPAVLSSNTNCVKLFTLVNKKVNKFESVKKKLQTGKGLCIPKVKCCSESKEGKYMG